MRFRAQRARVQVRPSTGRTRPEKGSNSGFVRDRATVLCYGALGAYAFWLYAFGPALALLQPQLRFSYALLGAYSTVWAVGATVVGASYSWCVRLVGRRRLLWGSAVLATVGAGLFALGGDVAVTMVGTALLGFAGTMVQVLVQSVLSDRHGSRRDRALVEANIGAGVCAVAAPLLLGLLQAGPVGWRLGLAAPALAFAVLAFGYAREPLTAGQTSTPTETDAARQAANASLTPKKSGAVRGRRVGLPVAAWLFAVLVAFGIGVEFCVIYFGAELLTDIGLRTDRAATAMSAFYLGILVGRVIGGRLTRHPGRTVTLLWGSLAVTLLGFLGFWLTGAPVPAVLGLFVCGLGVANLFPLSLALTLAAAPGRTDTANSASQLLGGVLLIGGPFLLGGLADRLGLTTAFAVEPILVVASTVLLVLGLRLRHRD